MYKFMEALKRRKAKKDASKKVRYLAKFFLFSTIWLGVYLGSLLVITHDIQISLFGALILVSSQVLFSKIFYYIFFNFTQKSKKLKVFEFYSINNVINQVAKNLSINVKNVYLFEHALPNLFIIPKGKSKIDVYMSFCTTVKFTHEEIKYLFAIEIMHYYSHQLHFKKLWLFNNFYFILFEVILHKLFAPKTKKQKKEPFHILSSQEDKTEDGQQDLHLSSKTLIFYFFKTILNSIYNKTFNWIVPPIRHQELDQSMLKIFGHRTQFLNLLLKIYSLVQKTKNKTLTEDISFVGYLFTVPMLDKQYLETTLYQRIKGLKGLIIIPTQFEPL